jgi:hypothetical protein
VGRRFASGAPTVTGGICAGCDAVCADAMVTDELVASKLNKIDACST